MARSHWKLLLVLLAMGSADARADSEVNPIKARSFSVPITIPDGQKDKIREIQVFASSDEGKTCSKVRPLSVAFLFAETIRRISDGESVTSLFAEQNSNF